MRLLTTVHIALADAVITAKEVGHDWVSLVWQKPEKSTSQIITYKVEAWLCGEGAYWVEASSLLMPAIGMFAPCDTLMLDDT